MNAEFGTDFGKKYMTLQEIKKNLGQAKKAELHYIFSQGGKPPEL
jgi:hypothetical protein